MPPSRAAMKTLRRPGVRLALFLLVLILPASCRHERPAARRAPLPSLTDLNNVEDLRTRFNREAGAPRMVLLFSPT